MQEVSDLKQVLNDDFPGMETLAKRLIAPVFCEDYELGKPNDLLYDEDYASKARNAHIIGANRYKKIENDAEGVEVYEIILDNSCHIHQARVGIQSIVRSDMLNFTNALIFFHYSDVKDKTWRLSYAHKSGSQKNMTTAKRYTYLLGKKFSSHTLIERLNYLKNQSNITTQALETAFSVETLTKEFYGNLFNWYLWAVDPQTGVTFPNATEDPKDDRERIEIKMIRLITRMLFVWFIKQKNLVPDNLFNTEYLGKILHDFDSESSEQSNYYNAILQNLFFATLNQEIGSRAFIQPGYHGKSDNYTIKNLYRDRDKNSWFKFDANEKEEKVKALFASVPYLNGGLFDCLDKYKLDNDNNWEEEYLGDGFSSRNNRSSNGNLKYRAFIPNCLFFAPVHKVKLSNGREIEVEGLISLFSRYNFTVEENSTDDINVSLDPELLGKVFENLLAAYNPETEESARKDSGSFYTPRTIVEFMVEQAISNYLVAKGYEAEMVKHLVSGDSGQIPKQAEQIIADIKSMKILDPACGSGAFPMGCLQKMVEIIEHLEGNGFDKYKTKLDIIQNCIYGVDIQAIAMLICKLRFFISIICDCEYDATKENFGITPLPNLETKFVAANTLLSAEIRQYESDIWQDPELVRMKNELIAKRKEVVKIKSQKEKKKNLVADRKICEAIEQYILKNTAQPSEVKIRMLEKQIEDYEKQKEQLKGERWIDEAKEQQSLFDEPNPSLFRYDANKKRRGELDVEIRRCKEVIAREKDKGKAVGFAHAVKQVTTDWNPYDQNAVAGFFDADWMFGINDGFDIVIGNPPYIQLQNNGGALGSLYKNCGYDTFSSGGDIYCLFYERGWQVLREGGHLCYITSNKWMRAGYGENTRKFFANKTNPKLLIDFAGVKIFESATVDTNILLFERGKNQHNTLCAVTSKQNKDSVKNLSVFVQQNGTSCDFSSSDSWVILSPIEQSIKQKIESVGTPLKDWDINIYRGVLTGCNEAFIVSTEKRDEILANCKTEEERKKTAELIRPILRGRDIKRYGYNWANLWLIYIPWHFPLQFDNSITGASEKAEKAFKEQYPAVYAHMLQFKEPLSKRNKAETGIRYEWYAMQRWGANYWDLFFQPHICWKAVGRKLAFALVEGGTFLTAPASFISAGKYNNLILTYLCSNVGTYFIYKNSDTTGAGDIMLNIQSLIKFPVPIADTEISTLTDEDKEHFVYTSYGFTKDEILYIESQI